MVFFSLKNRIKKDDFFLHRNSLPINIINYIQQTNTRAIQPSGLGPLADSFEPWLMWDVIRFCHVSFSLYIYKIYVLCGASSIVHIQIQMKELEQKFYVVQVVENTQCNFEYAQFTPNFIRVLYKRCICEICDRKVFHFWLTPEVC